MALERQSIERKDFPIGRRGYEPEAVDAHLSQLADEVEQLTRSTRRQSETVAATASDEVRVIVEAAERSAAHIRRRAEEEAQQLRDEASSETRARREGAADEAREYVAKVSEATHSMLKRIEAMENELGALVESLRTGSNRLSADLQLLEGNLSEARDSVAPERPALGPRETAAEAVAEPAATAAAEPEPAETVIASASPPHMAADERAATTEARSDDTEGARLIALNMALNGTPREETERYLEENFRLPDRSGLLDEVYASVEG